MFKRPRKKREKEDKLTSIGKVVAEQVSDVMSKKLTDVEKGNKDVLKSLEEIKVLIKKLNKVDSGSSEEEKPPTYDEWCETAMEELKTLKKRSKSKIKKKLWDEKLVDEHDNWETLFHLAKMLIEKGIGDKEKLTFKGNMKLDDALDAVCEALV